MFTHVTGTTFLHFHFEYLKVNYLRHTALKESLLLLAGPRVDLLETLLTTKSSTS